MSKLVIVESPTKAKTIQKYLPDDYLVLASRGHVRDLPENASQLPEEHRKKSWSSLGVNIDEDFTPIYITADDILEQAKTKKKDGKEAEGKGKKRFKRDPNERAEQRAKILDEIKKALKKAKGLILATDEDREGEAISWHLVELLAPKVPIQRMVFHEITKTAIQEALENTRTINQDLVTAQETRRILDRLVGYPLSLLVSKKIKMGLSAGRVQSVAVRLLVERERQRRTFRSSQYWDIKGTFASSASPSQAEIPFEAVLVSVDRKRLASGRDFDDQTGLLSKKDLILFTKDEVDAIGAALQASTWKVQAVSESPVSAQPKPPFTTSTLQQEASRKLGFSSSDTMRLAQRLYEEGFITYMRTDSVHLSEQAIQASRSAIQTLYGPTFLPEKPRLYASKSKNAQEAHEAIRPSGDTFVQPARSGLEGNELRLYDLIWKRTVASQMVDAKKTSLRAEIETAADSKAYLFVANGLRIDFPGYLRAYVEGSDDPEAQLDDQQTLLPPLRPGDPLLAKALQPAFHETKPPPRYTEASLVKALEEEGIGRPSTYASIMDKLASDERYARRQGKNLVPTYLAFSVTHFLETAFDYLVDVKFTAQMEDQLDDIAQGKLKKVDYLHKFYRDKGAFRDQIEEKEKSVDAEAARLVPLEGFPPSVEIRVGRFGTYAQIKDNQGPEEKRVNIPEDIPPADLSMDDLFRLLQQQAEGPKVLASDSGEGEKIAIKKGPYGWYIESLLETPALLEAPAEPPPEDPKPAKAAKGRKKNAPDADKSPEDQPKKAKKTKATAPVEKPRRTSIPRWLSHETLEYATAQKLLSLPRRLGVHPEDEKPIEAGIGPYGSYLKHGEVYRNLDQSELVLEIQLPEALEILAAPKKDSKRSLGSYQGKDVLFYPVGRFGPYVKCGKTIASLPKSLAPEDISLEKATLLIQAKEAKDPPLETKAQASSSPRRKKKA